MMESTADPIYGNETYDEIFTKHATEEICKWYKDWSAGEEFGFESKCEIARCILDTFEKMPELLGKLNSI